MFFNIATKKAKIISEIFFIALITLGIIYLVALFSYSADDNLWPSDSDPVTNKAGIIGAWVSYVSIHSLGYVSYIIPIATVLLGYKIHKNTVRTSSYYVMGIRFMVFIILLIFSCSLIQNMIKTSHAGGWVGETAHNYFNSLFGPSVTIIYLSIIVVCYMILSTTTLANIITRIKNFIHIIFKIKKKKSIVKKNTPIHNLSKVINKRIKTTSNTFNKDPNNKLPSLNLLSVNEDDIAGYSEQELTYISSQVKIKLKDFGFDVEINAINPGPIITQFELSLAPGVKVSQISGLSKDLARALLVESVRIVDVIPGKPVIGLEIPNANYTKIYLKEILSSTEFKKSTSPLTIALGKSIIGEPVIIDLAKMPHLLVSGATGMGKSVGLNAMIISILYKSRADEVRMIMIDPKIVELACYADIPHLLTPVITDMNQAASALFWCVNEMERRYSLLEKFSIRNIENFNQKLIQAKKNGKPLLDPTFNADTSQTGETAKKLEKLPLIVLIIDEYADMLAALAQTEHAKSKRVESLIIRIAQKARAAGIYLIIATQRPSVDIITGLIKSNIPSRISYKVSSKVDSRTVLDQGGAEQLLGSGDMLYKTPGTLHLHRVHGAFVNDEEINNVVKYLKENSTTNYLPEVINTKLKTNNTNKSLTATNDEEEDEDELYDQAVKIVTSTRRASISSIQRRLRIGYNRAARIIEIMEKNNVVSTINNTNNTREVLAPKPIE